MDISNTQINKRKHSAIHYDCEMIAPHSCKLYDKYYNVLNCDKLVLANNHIYFDSLINNESISHLIKFINSIIANKHLFTFNDFSLVSTKDY